MQPLPADASAPAKVILMGEHAVVYGQPALAAPVADVASHARAEVGGAGAGLELRAEFPPFEQRPALRWRIPAGPLPIHPAALTEDSAPLLAVLLAALESRGYGRVPEWRIDVRSAVPTGRGMGSSASVAIALARAATGALGAVCDASEAVELAMAAERLVHGTPSGIDPTVIAHGLPIRFERAAGGARWSALHADRPLRLVIADSGSPGDTGEMVARVRSRMQADEKATRRLMAEIGNLVGRADAALAVGNLDAVGRLMTTNHELLAKLGVSTRRLDQLVSGALGAGAGGAKLSGAGGGGIVIALVDDAAEARVERALIDAGAARTWLVTVGESGDSSHGKHSVRAGGRPRGAT